MHGPRIANAGHVGVRHDERSTTSRCRPGCSSSRRRSSPGGHPRTLRARRSAGGAHGPFPGHVLLEGTSLRWRASPLHAATAVAHRRNGALQASPRPRPPTLTADPLGGSSRLAQLLDRAGAPTRGALRVRRVREGLDQLRHHGHLPADLGAAAVPGRRPREHDPARAEGDPPLHDALGDEEDARGEGDRGQPPDAQDRVQRHVARGRGDRQEGAGEDALQHRRRGDVRRRRLLRQGHAERWRRRRQGIGADQEGDARERAQERAGVPAAAPHGGRHQRERGNGGDHLPRDPEPERRARGHLPLLRAAAHLPDQRAHPRAHAGRPRRERRAGTRTRSTTPG